MQFFTLGGVPQSELDALKPVWESGIEDFWSNKYVVVRGDIDRFPIVFDVTYGGPIFHYGVNVAPGRTVNMLNWGTEHGAGESHETLAAHEYGHMFGLFDEYPGGATNPTGELIDPTSIMGSVAFGAIPYARHYEGFRDWLAAKDPNEDFTIAQVPEPVSILLLAIGVGLVKGRRAFRQRKS